MKILIVFDSKYGNTKKIAESMAEVIVKANEVKVVQAAEAVGIALQDYELIIVGSPTNGGQPSQAVKVFLDSIPEGKLAGKRAAAFDTGSTLDGQGFIGRTAIKLFGYAAPRTAKMLEAKGANVITSETFFVKGFEGPIITGEIERAQKWAMDLLK